MSILDRNNKEEVNKYNKFLKESKYTRMTQDLNWKEIKNNWDNVEVFLKENGEIVAAMSCLYIKIDDDKTFFYAPRGPVCDFYDRETVEKLIDSLKDFMKEKNAVLLRMDPEVVYDEKLLDIYEGKLRTRGLGERKFSQLRNNMIMDIKGKTEEEVFENLHKKARYNIRLSDRKGIKTRVSTDEKDIDVFYDLTKIMSQRQGISHRPKDYFKRLLKYFDTRIFISEYEGKPLSAAICIKYKKRMFYIYGASSNEHRNRMPNFNMQWAMIKYAIEEGCDEYDLGGVYVLNDSSGLYRFKRQFAQVVEYIGEYDYVLDKKAYEKFLNR